MASQGPDERKLLYRLQGELGLEGSFARELLTSEWELICADIPFNEDVALSHLAMAAIERLWSAP